VDTLNLKDFLSKSRLKHFVIYFCTFLVIYFVLITALLTKTYDLKEGDISKISIKAQREIKDDASTKARLDEALKLIVPEYSIKPEVKNNAISSIELLFFKTVQLKKENLEDKEKISRLAGATGVGLSDEDYALLLKTGDDDLKTLQDFLSKTMIEVYDFSIHFNSELSAEENNENLKKAQDIVQMKFNNSKFAKTMRDLGTTIGIKLVKPNSFYDKEKTDQKKNEIIEKTPPIMVKKDQTIVMEGEQISAEKYALLKSLGLLNTNSKSEWYIYISLAVIIFLILFLQSFYLYKYQREVYDDWSKLLLINMINCIVLVLARTLSMVSPLLIPLAFAPMLITLLINHRVSLTVSILNVVLISCAVNFNIEIIIVALLNVVIGALVLQKLHQRNDILYSCLYIAIINVLTVLAIGFLLSNNEGDILLKTAFSIIASALSGILTVGLLPFFESSFDIVTTIKLLELSNPNSPLLKKLLIEAPGTYHHSILVANLAEVAAEAVGGNPVLARVCSYYHDVGKIKRPYFFKENQIGSDNPHNKITPNLSALIITSHVKDGLEFAKDYKLPKVIQDIIEEHHGTSLVKYFYVTAKNSSEKPEDVKEEDFKYSGPIPTSKESGVVMLADSVEASVRSISEPTLSKIEDMVNNIFKSRLNDGQLDNCDLTLKDLNKIKAAFIKSLMGIYHQRIEYPVDKWENKTKTEDKC
jgi:putative nucleotidyltransferase with HDIG domain